MKKKNLFFYLVLILGAAFLVRFLGFWVVGRFIDEATLLYRARQMMAGEEFFNPHLSQMGIPYGMLISYAQAFFMKIIYLLGFFFHRWSTIEEAYPILILTARFLSVLVGTATVYFTYLTAKKLFNPKVGLFSALILAFSFNHVAQSKYGLVDIYISLFLTVALYFSIMIFSKKRNRLKNYLLASAFSASAFALKYRLPVFVLLLVSHSLRIWQETPRQRNRFFVFFSRWWRKEIFLSAFVAAAVFVVVNPYLLVDPKDWFWQMKWVAVTIWNYAYGGKDLDNIPNVVWYVWHMASVGLYYPFCLFVFGGIIMAFRRYRRQAIVLLSYPVAQLIILEMVTLRSDRYIWWLPMLSIFAGVFLWISFDRLFSLPNRYWKKLALGSLVFLIALPIIRVIFFDWTITFQKDTRQEVREFLLQNPRPVYFMVDIDARFIGIGGLQVLNSHPLIGSSFDSRSPSPYNIFRYPGEYVLISSFISDDYLHRMRYNPAGIIFNKNPGTKLPYYLDYIQEARLVADFMKKAPFIKRYSHFLFGNNFYDSIMIPGGGTDIGYTSNPIVNIYKIPDFTRGLTPLAVTYYPEAVGRLPFELLLIVSGAKVVADSDAALGKVISLDGIEKEAIIRSLSSPFPSGGYRVDIRVKIDARLLKVGKIYGTVTFGDPKIRESLSYQKIRSDSLKKQSSYQTISLPFKLSDTSLTGVELIWIGMPAWVERIEIHQIKG